jgi:hypothetical protein
MRISEGHVMSVPSGANLVPVLNSQGYSSECKKPNISSSPIKELIGGSLSALMVVLEVVSAVVVLDYLAWRQFF